VSAIGTHATPSGRTRYSAGVDAPSRFEIQNRGASIKRRIERGERQVGQRAAGDDRSSAQPQLVQHAQPLERQPHLGDRPVNTRHQRRRERANQSRSRPTPGRTWSLTNLSAVSAFTLPVRASPTRRKSAQRPLALNERRRRGGRSPCCSGRHPQLWLACRPEHREAAGKSKGESAGLDRGPFCSACGCVSRRTGHHRLQRAGARPTSKHRRHPTISRASHELLRFDIRRERQSRLRVALYSFSAHPPRSERTHHEKPDHEPPR